LESQSKSFEISQYAKQQQLLHSTNNINGNNSNNNNNANQQDIIKQLREENNKIGEELLRKSQSLVDALKALADIHSNDSKDNSHNSSYANHNESAYARITRQLSHANNEGHSHTNSSHGTDNDKLKTTLLFTDITDQFQHNVEHMNENNNDNSNNDDNNNNTNENNDMITESSIFNQSNIALENTKLKLTNFKNKFNNKMKQSIHTMKKKNQQFNK